MKRQLSLARRRQQFLRTRMTSLAATCLRQMERQLSLARRRQQFGAHDVSAGVLGQFQVVDARHHTGQKVVDADVIVAAVVL